MSEFAIKYRKLSVPASMQVTSYVATVRDPAGRVTVHKLSHPDEIVNLPISDMAGQHAVLVQAYSGAWPLHEAVMHVVTVEPHEGVEMHEIDVPDTIEAVVQEPAADPVDVQEKAGAAAAKVARAKAAAKAAAGSKKK